MRRRFTLIEMLVVIAIISILAAMLSPALQKALQQAQGVSCANNMRNIFLAFTGYANDNQDRYPPLSVHNADNSWCSWWHRRVAGQYMDVNEHDGKKVRMIRCPSVPAYGIGYNNSDYPFPEFNTNILDYHSLNGVYKPTSKNVWKKITTGRNLNRLLILADSLSERGENSDSFGNTQDRIAYRHALRANVTFADGHIRTSDNLYGEYLNKYVEVKIK